LPDEVGRAVKTLTPKQQAAVLYAEGNSAILAGAGSGKTSVIVEKVATLIERLHVPPEKVLVVTFTEKAAAEVKERVASRTAAEGINVGTIHGFAAECLRRHDAPSDIRILNEFLADLEKARLVREKTVERIEAGDPETLDAVERFGFRKVPGLFLNLLSEPPHRRGGGAFPETLAFLKSAYAARKSALNAMDFDDLEEKLLTLLKAEPGAFAGKFSWIVVDEFQDTSPLQWEILETLQRLSGARLVVVGDPRQSIYRFRGADPSLFLKVQKAVLREGGRAFGLPENFRSAPEIVAFVNAVSEPLFAEDFPPMKAVRPPGGTVERLAIPGEGTLGEFREAEAAAVARRLASLRKEGHLWKTMAVLFKTRKAVPAYEGAFKAEGIPYRTSLGEPLLERPEVLALLFWMERRAGATERRTAFLDTGLSHSPLKDFKEEIPPDPLPTCLDTLFEKTGPLFPEDARANLAAFRALLNDLMGLGVGHLKALVRNLQALREEGARISCPQGVDAKTDAVTLMTVHGAKGLEWPIVVLGDLKAAPVRPPSLYLASEDGDLLLKDSDASASGLKDRLVKNEAYLEREAREREEDLEESKRLLYVGLTRARDRLVLPLPQPKEGDKQGKGRSVPSGRSSEWLIR
jgi:superfamily I DNA/RNA helicase